jgi:hypothetical protein
MPIASPGKANSGGSPSPTCPFIALALPCRPNSELNGFNRTRTYDLELKGPTSG